MTMAIQVLLAFAKKIPWYLYVIITILSASAFAVKRLQSQILDLTTEAAVAGIAAENRLALAEKSYKIEIVTLNDTVSAYTRRIQQVKLVNDSIDDVLKQQAKVRVDLSITVDSLNTRLADVLVIDSVGNRTANLHKRQAPYTIDLFVLVPQSDSIIVEASVVLDQAIIDVRIGCTEQLGVNAAHLTLLPPEWLTVEIREVEQDPVVCNSDLVNFLGDSDPPFYKEVWFISSVATFIITKLLFR